MNWLLLLCLFGSTFAECPPIISKEEWGGRQATSVTYIAFPLEFVIIQHTVTSPCFNLDDCSNSIISMQNYHMSPKQDYGDISYSFLVGGDGRIYEGRGWHKQGAHTFGYNSRSIGIAFIGTFINEKPTEVQLQAAKNLLECGVELGELTTDYKLYGASQVSATESPGTKLLNKLTYWPHFASP